MRLVDVNVVFDGLRTAIGTPAPGLPFPLWALPALDVLIPNPVTLPTGEPVLSPTGQPTPMSACLFVAPGLCTDVPVAVPLPDGSLMPVRLPDGSFATPFPLLFWDVVHPTTFAHSQLADYLYGQLLQQ